MKNYTFTNLTFKITEAKSLVDPKYYPFRPASEAVLSASTISPCTICTELVPSLSLQNTDPIFITETGMRIYVKNGIEYRYACDFFTGEVRALLIDDGKEKVLQIAKDSMGEPRALTELELLNALGLEKTMSEHGRFILHASFIEVDGEAILFTAPSQTGKSTQASLWEKYRGAEIINGDRAGIWKADACISNDAVDDSGVADNSKNVGIWMAGGVPWCGTSGIMKNKMMPLRAIAILQQGPDNVISQLPLPVKLSRLLEQTTINPWNREMLIRAKFFWMDLCQEIPVYLLTCRPDEGAVEVLEQALKKEHNNHGK